MAGLARPLVSIGIPTYQRPTELVNTVRQIMSQSYSNLEIIICDNGGSVTDELFDLIGTDSRFRIIINETNIGLLRNTEKVLRLSHGDFFCWFSDDDWHSPHFIEILLDKLLVSTDRLCAFSNFHEKTHDRSVVSPYRNKLSQNLEYMVHPNKFWRLTRFYFDDDAKGKCNVFYGLFNTSFLKKINFRDLSSQYTDFAMDKYIVLELLKQSQPLIAHDTLISLTCNNQKYYQISKKLNVFEKLWIYLLEQIDFFKKMRALVDSDLLKHFLMILFLPKLFSNIFDRSFHKVRGFIFKNGKDWLAYRKLFGRSQKSAAILNLPDVTLVCVATKDVERAVLALKYSQINIKFFESVLFSHYQPEICSEIKHVKIDPFPSVEEWGRFIVFNLHKYINTDYIILIHDDGFIVNAGSWDDEFLKYDYIGAPWPCPKDKFSYRTPAGELVRVGNSVSLRSKKILELPSALELSWLPFNGFLHEDGFLAVQHRETLSHFGVRYGSFEIAQKFGREYADTTPDPFTFHKWSRRNKMFPNFSAIE